MTPTAIPVASFDWSSLIPVGTALLGGIVALIGVNLTYRFNGNLKQLDFERQDMIVKRQRIYDSGNKIIESIHNVNKHYIEILLKNQGIVASTKHLYTFIVLNNDIEGITAKNAIEDLDSWEKKLYDIKQSTTTESIEVDIRVRVNNELNKNIVWFDDTGIIEEYRKYIIQAATMLSYTILVCYNDSIKSNKLLLEEIGKQNYIEYIMRRGEYLVEVENLIENQLDEINNLTIKLAKHIISEYDATQAEPRPPSGRQG